MVKSLYQNVVQNQNRVFENVQKYKFLGVTETNTNDIGEEIKRTISMEYACNYSLEKMLSARMLSRKPKVNTYKTVILPVLYCTVVKIGISLSERSRG